MDINQVKNLIDALSAMTTAMSAASANQVPSVNIITNFDAFDLKQESFKTYKERLELHFQIKNIFQDKQLCAKLLLQYIGSINYSLLTSLAAPASVNELQYDVLIKLLDEYYCPKKNVLVEQHKFFCELQCENQSISEFVVQLRNRAIDCAFICKCKKSVADIFLRAQFIRGLRDDYCREQLLQIAEEDFNKVVDKAIALEAAKANNKEIMQQSNSSTEINQLKHTQKHKFNKNKTFQSKNKSIHQKINYNHLGIDGLCLRCGRNNHMANKCKTNKNNLHCEACNKYGHVKKVCIKSKMRSTPMQTNDSYQPTHTVQHNIETESMGINKIIDVYNSNLQYNESNKFYVNIAIEGKSTKFEVDSGAGYTLISTEIFNKLNLKLPIQKTNVLFRTYTGNIFKPLGVVNVKVAYKNKQSIEQMYIVPTNNTPLLGRVWIRHLNINLHEIDEIPVLQLDNMKASVHSVQELYQKYADIFEQRVGCIPNIYCSIQLQQNAKPIFIKERQVPFALREIVEKELDSLEKDGIITKVNISNWGSPLVVIPKADGGVRLCVDYKVGVNPQLKAAHYPIKRIDEILNQLKNSKYFCKLDLYKAYLHVKVDEESSQIQTISTHRGTYQMNRLSFGIKTAPSEFNRILDQILHGLEGTLAYFDDIIVFANTEIECKKRLTKLFECLRQHQLHLNKAKCEFFQTRIQYLGHIICHNEISKCPEKVEAIVNMPRPQNVDQIRKFLGMVTYYSKFIPNASSITFPLRQLLEKNKKFHWSDKCERTFKLIKQELTTDRVLIPFNEKLPIILACDASPYGIGAVISHVINGEERPIAFISRALTKTEQNYSQLDREALAIIFAVDKFYMYLYAREFTLVTDNRPLTRIFHQNAKTPAMTSARLLRYASFLQGFNYKIQHRRAEDNSNADCLSRAPIEMNQQFERNPTEEEITNIQDQTINQISTFSITATSIAQETERDPELSQLKRDLQCGLNQLPNYSIQKGIIFKNNRVYIPASLREEVLAELHRTHIGIVKMKQLARRYCYWKNIDNDIEKLIRSCVNCGLVQKNPPKVVTHHWDEPHENFERVHIDYAGPFLNHHFLVLVDARSKWPEIRILKDAPSSEKTIELLTDIFTTHGFPRTIVSDNATIFQSNQFRNYCRENGITQNFIAPGHPATNGLAERHIQTLKIKLKAMKEEKTTLRNKVQQILLQYRATPLANNKSPAQQYLGRNIRIKLDAMFPIKHIKSPEASKLPLVRSISVGERVQVRWLERNVYTWKLGVVTQKYGRLHYQVKLDNGYSLKRHINQLTRSNVQEQKEVVGETTTKPKKNPAIEEMHIQWRNNGTVNREELQTKIPSEPVEQTPSNVPVQASTSVTSVRKSSRARKPPAFLSDHVIN